MKYTITVLSAAAVISLAPGSSNAYASDATHGGDRLLGSGYAPWIDRDRDIPSSAFKNWFTFSHPTRIACLRALEDAFERCIEAGANGAGAGAVTSMYVMGAYIICHAEVECIY